MSTSIDCKNKLFYINAINTVCKEYGIKELLPHVTP